MQKINEVRDETPRPLRRITTARSRALLLSSAFLRHRRRFSSLFSFSFIVGALACSFFLFIPFMCWRWRMVWYSIKLSIIILFSLSSLKIVLCVQVQYTAVLRCARPVRMNSSPYVPLNNFGWLACCVRAATCLSLSPSLPFHIVQLSAFGIYILGITLKSFLPTHRYYY